MAGRLWRSLRFSWTRLAEGAACDFTRVGRGQVAPLAAEELRRTLSAAELEELREASQIESIWETFSDEDYGGDSRMSWALSGDEGGKAVFSGRLSNGKGKTGQRGFDRSGYCAIKMELPAEQQDVSDFSGVEILFKSDGRKYTFNLQPESFIPDDLYQGYLIVDESAKNQWISAILPFERLILTGRGHIKEDQRMFDHDLVRSLGIALHGDQAGDFMLELKHIKFVNISHDALLNHANPAANSLSRNHEAFEKLV